ncbi:MAG: O-antigen polymerase [Bacteroidota bacterium]
MFYELTLEELVPFIGLMIVVMVILIFNFTRSYVYCWSPLVVVALVFGYYCLLGPYEAIRSGETRDRLMDMRRFYESSFWGAFVTVVSILVGYLFNNAPGRRSQYTFNNELLGFYGRRLYLIGFVLFTISTGGNVGRLINPLDSDGVQQIGGSFANYLFLSLNFLIPAVTLLFLYFLRTRKGLAWFIIACLIAVGIFISLGFRYRIVILFGAMAVAYFYNEGKKPNLVVMAVGIAVFIGLMGVINITRQYGRGLDLTKLEDRSTANYYESGLREAMIFQTSGAVIDVVPYKHPHAGWTPIWSTITFPIPSALYKEKNSAVYLLETLDAIYGEKLSQGAAMMAYGEYYLAFGWAGIVIGGFLTGWYCKKLWKWYLANSDNPFVISAYAVTVSYLYFVVSRGYLPLIVNLFFFTAFPAYFVWWLVRRRHSRSTKAFEVQQINTLSQK